jgi:hypothetical protein
MRRHDLRERLAQGELRRLPGDLQLGLDVPGNLEHLDVEERNPELQRVRHRHLVGFDEDVAAQPGEEVDVLHPGNRVPSGAGGVDRISDVPE